MPTKKPNPVADFIAASPKEVRAKLKEMRACLKKALPDADEALKWSAPTFMYKRIICTYDAYKDHISLFPTPSAIRAFKKELTKYKTSKGTIQFPLDKPLPKGLITKIAKFRAKELKTKDARWM